MDTDFRIEVRWNDEDVFPQEGMGGDKEWVTRIGLAATRTLSHFDQAGLEKELQPLLL